MTAGVAATMEPLVAAIGSELDARIAGHAERLDWDAEQLAAHQRERLRELLSTAIERSPFHAQRLRGIDPRTFELGDLPRLPVMGKRGDDGRVRRRGHRPAAQPDGGRGPSAAASSCEPSLLLGEYVCLASGGSSGVRGDLRAPVGRVRGVRRVGHAPGWSRIGRDGGTAARRRARRESSPRRRRSTPRGLRRRPSSEGPFRFEGSAGHGAAGSAWPSARGDRPRALDGLPRQVGGAGAASAPPGACEISPLAVSSTSEPLTPEVRDAIEAGFGVPVVDQFASTEGLVGRSEPGGSVLTFASRHVHRRARRRRPPTRAPWRDRGQGARDQPSQPHPAADPLRAH